MPIAATISAVSAVAGGAIAASGAKSAAKTQAAAATTAAGEQTALGQEALDYQKGIDTRTQTQTQPYQEYGSGALPGLSALLGYGPGGQAGIETELQSLPGYQFAQDQGVKAINNAVGSQGLTGAQSKGIARFVTGMADQTYGNQIDRLNTAAQTGLSAVATGANAGVGTGTNVGNTTSNTGNAIAAGLTGAANASAGGTIGAANAASGAIGGLGNSYLISQLLGNKGAGGLYTTTTGFNPADYAGEAAVAP